MKYIIDSNSTFVRSEFTREFGEKGIASSATYFFIAAIYFFYFEQSTNKAGLLLSAGLAGISLYRFFLGRKLLTAEFPLDYSKSLFWCNIANTLIFHGTSFLALHSIGYASLNILWPILFALAFMTGSPFTLSYSKLILVLFNVIGALVILGRFYYELLIEKSVTSLFTSFILNFSIGFMLVLIYSIKQGLAHRKQVIEKLIFAENLQLANAELVESKKQILAQIAIAENANRMASIGEMAAGVAHEINNPLSIINGNLILMEAKLASEKENPTYKTVFEKIDKMKLGINRITKIIKGLKYLTQSDTRRELHEEVDAKLMIDEIIVLNEQKLKNLDIELQNHLKSQLILQCNSVQISQIFINLLNNAIDALQLSNQNPKIISIRCLQNEETFTFIVANSGPEIPNALQNKIFSPFFTTKLEMKGTGLGLSISKNIATNHNGRLYYQYDEAQQHVQFCLELPKRQQHENVF